MENAGGGSAVESTAAGQLPDLLSSGTGQKLHIQYAAVGRCREHRRMLPPRPC